MRLRSVVFASLAALVLASAGCNNAQTGLPPPPPPVNGSTNEPTADVNVGAIGTLYDLVGLTTSRQGPPNFTYTVIVVTLTFLQPVAIPAPGASVDPTTLAGFIHFDTDNNSATGANYGFCPQPPYLGIDYDVFLFTRLPDGNFPVIFHPTAITSTLSGEAFVTLNGTSVTYIIPISALGGSAIGPFHVASSIGNAINPTDCDPASGTLQPATVQGPIIFKKWGQM